MIHKLVHIYCNVLSVFDRSKVNYTLRVAILNIIYIN